MVNSRLVELTAFVLGLMENSKEHLSSFSQTQLGYYFFPNGSLHAPYIIHVHFCLEKEAEELRSNTRESFPIPIFSLFFTIQDAPDKEHYLFSVTTLRSSLPGRQDVLSKLIPAFPEARENLRTLITQAGHTLVAISPRENPFSV